MINIRPQTEEKKIETRLYFNIFYLILSENIKINICWNEFGRNCVGILNYTQIHAIIII